jgi:hypothetical protein
MVPSHPARDETARKVGHGGAAGFDSENDCGIEGVVGRWFRPTLRAMRLRARWGTGAQLDSILKTIVELKAW